MLPDFVFSRSVYFLISLRSHNNRAQILYICYGNGMANSQGVIVILFYVCMMMIVEFYIVRHKTTIARTSALLNDCFALTFSFILSLKLLRPPSKILLILHASGEMFKKKFLLLQYAVGNASALRAGTFSYYLRTYYICLHRRQHMHTKFFLN